jgi:ubiquinone/menaquinone biosynthesis C-methylase UbiE
LEGFDASRDLPLRVMALYGLTPNRVLEVGASNGVRLSTIQRVTGAETVALDVSSDAIIAGRRRYPAVKFVVANANAIPFQDPFDLVIVNFVFHWIDRNYLLRSIAEVDRVVAEGGYLLIGDFHPTNFLRARYHHLPREDIFTYKQCYAAVFLASGLYRSVCLMTADHANFNLCSDAVENERAGVQLLRKELQGRDVSTG